jgi:protein phosphatase 2C family protein 2/3
MNIKSKKQSMKWKDKERDSNGGLRYVLDPSKMSNKKNGNITAYAVNSNQGILRKYNEDRVSIILNVNKNGVKASYFAIYDGHGGSSCCDFLTQNLHQFIFNSKKFPINPRQAII